MFTRSYYSFRVFPTQKYQEHTSMPRCCLLVEQLEMRDRKPFATKLLLSFTMQFKISGNQGFKH